MTDEEDIRGLLEAAPAPPPGVDIGGVVDRGRRAVARRRTAGVAGAGSLALVLVAATVAVLGVRSGSGHTPATTLAGSKSGKPEATASHPSQPGTTTRPYETTPSTPPPAAATVTCAATALAVPAGYDNVSAGIIDPSGRYVGGESTIGQDFVPIMWIDGVPRVVPAHGQSAEIGAINSHGVAVGTILSNNYRDQVIFRYQDGVLTKLRSPVPKSWNLYPQPYINEAGAIVVNAEPPGHSGGDGSIVIEWSPGATTGHVLAMREIDDVLAIGGDFLAGGSYPGGIGQDALVWDTDGGNARTLGHPAGMSALVYGVGGHFAVGGFWTADDRPLPALWDLSTGKFTQPPLNGPLQSVNAKGWTVDGTRAYLGGPIGAFGPLPGHSAGTANGVAIADDGTVAGDVADNDGTVPAVWHC